MSNDSDPFGSLDNGLSNRLFFRLYQAANALHKTGTRALEAHGITTQQWAVLGALMRKGAEKGTAVGDLASYLQVSRQNLTGVLSRLEAQGYIERAVDPQDSRSRLIRMTTSGENLWRAEMSPKIIDYYEAALVGFSNTDKIHLIHYLDKLLSNFNELDRNKTSGPDQGDARKQAPSATPEKAASPSAPV